MRRRSWQSKAIIDEAICPISDFGCAVEEITVSPSGNWLVTQRYSGQGEWGYDIFQLCPLVREAGITEEHGYMLELPRFSVDEERLVGGFGLSWLGGWWAYPGVDLEGPVRGGPVSFGFLFVHHLPSHRIDRYELRINLPAGWLSDDPWAEWLGPSDIEPTAEGVRFLPS